MAKISAAEAAALVPEGAVLMAGGFGMTGNPVHLLHALAETSTEGLTIISNNVGEVGLGGGRLLQNGQLRKAIGSFFTSNPEAVAAAQSGDLEVQLIPQGSMSEAIRAGGAGIGGFYTKTSVGTALADTMETKVIEGETYVFVPALRADVAFVRAWRADEAGNLIYKRTEQNFNPLMATAAKLVIAEVDEIVPVGEIGPDAVHTQGSFVDYLVKAHTTEADLGSSGTRKGKGNKVSPERLLIAARALKELTKGDVVNLGVGIPTLVADLITPAHQVVLHTENGMLGVGPAPKEGGALDFPVNAGKQPVTALPGASYFDSATSFAMIRGGHVDVSIMGGLQVDEAGNLANWAVPGRPLLGVGGAMDLATGARRLIVTMTHCDRKGRPKVVSSLNLPATALNAVDTVITELAVFKCRDGRLKLVELMPGATLEQVQASTDACFDVLLKED